MIQRFKLATSKLNQGVVVWYENLKSRRRKKRKEQIDLRERLKKKMINTRVDKEYEQEQHLMIANLNEIK